MIPAIITTKARMTREPSSSSVSIRFWTSIADSSWAVPSLASRSSSAFTMPWTSRVETRSATTATMTITRIRRPFVRRTSTIVLSGGLLKSIAAMVAGRVAPRRTERRCRTSDGRDEEAARSGTGWLAAAVALAIWLRRRPDA